MVKRLLCVVSHPIQYQAPLFRHLSQLPDLDLMVLFHRSDTQQGYFDREFQQKVTWDLPLTEGYKWGQLPVRTYRQSSNVSTRWALVRRPLSVLREMRPDALWVHGYAHPINLQMILAAKILRIPVLVRAEVEQASAQGSAPVRVLKDAVLRVLYRLFDGFLVIGSNNAAYYRARGVPDHKMFLVPYAVNNAFFAEGVADGQRTGSGPLRVLFAAKLIAKKRPQDVVLALSKLWRQDVDINLTIVGDGELRPDLEALVKRYSPEGRVAFLGFQNQEAMRRVYQEHDVIVLPSDLEPWGLVINEAMAAGLVPIASQAVAAAQDLIVGKDSGFVFPVADTDVLAAQLMSLVNEPERLRTMRQNALQVMSDWDFAADARGLQAALVACSAPPREP